MKRMIKLFRFFGCVLAFLVVLENAFFSCCVSLLDPLSWLEMFLLVLLIFLILFPNPFCFFFVAGATTRTQNINKNRGRFFPRFFSRFFLEMKRVSFEPPLLFPLH